MSDSHQTQKIKERFTDTFNNNSSNMQISSFQIRMNSRNEHINNFLFTKKFKEFEDIEDSIREFDKNQNMTDFQQLNLLKEMNVDVILQNINNLKLDGIKCFFNNLENSKKLIISIRKLICRNVKNCYIQLLNYGCDVVLIDVLFDYSKRELYTFNDIDFTIILEIFWCMNNLLCIEKSPIFKTLIERNFIPYIVNFLEFDNEELSKQILSCLGNIIVEDLSFRDLILNQTKLIKKLITMSKNIHNGITMTNNLLFVFKSLARGNPKPPITKISEIINIVSSYLWNKHQEIIVDCIWILSLLSDGSEEYQKKILNLGIIGKINEYATVRENNIQLPCLRIIGNLMAGENSNTEILINQGCFNTLCIIISQNYDINDILREVVWCLLNLSKTNTKIINLMIDNKKFFPALKDLFIKVKDSKIISKFLKVIINFNNKGDDTTKNKFIENDIFLVLEGCLKSKSQNLYILKYVIMFINDFIGVEEVELLLQNYIENLAKSYNLFQISEILSFINTDGFIKNNAQEILKINFISLIHNKDLKNKLLESESLLNQKYPGSDYQCEINYMEKDLKRLKKLTECIKYSEILFNFSY